MNEAVRSDGPLISESTFAGKSIPIVQSSPERVVLHRVKDEELDILTMADQSNASNLATLAIGAGVGFLQNLFTVVAQIASTERITPILWDMTAALLCVAFLGIGLTLYVMAQRQAATGKALKEAIRARALIPTA